MDLIDDIAAMFSNAAWHAAYTRMRWGKGKSAAATKDEFEARYKYIVDSGELSERLCTHLKWMTWNAAWFTANTRAGNHQDAAKDKVGFERHARAVLGDIHRGVSLGGWLLLQRWMCAGVFSGVSERDAWDEFSLCAHLGRELAERRIIAWRDSWISRYERKRMHLCMLACIQACLHVPASRHTLCRVHPACKQYVSCRPCARVLHLRARIHNSDDFVELAQTGFNAVRLPLGYWCVEGLEAVGLSYEPFVGPCMRYLDLAVEWCRELGLRLVLDLHAAPGFQNKKETCGRADEGWEAWTWNTEATVGVLALLASHYTQRGWAGVVRGISVLHAPSTDIPISDLVGFYCNAYSALRRGGMAESAVAIHFPVHYRSLERLRELGFPHNEMQNVILDLQLYHTKGDKWLSYKTQQHLEAAQDPASHTPGLPHVLAAGCEVCVSEWNLQLPFADIR